LNKSFYSNIVILVFLFLSTTNLIGQFNTVQQDSTIQDSTSYVANDNRYGLLSSFSGKPGRAALVGLIVPAGGQFYNRRYIKGSIFLAAELAGIWYALDRSSYYNLVDECYKIRLQNGVCNDPTLGTVDITTLRNHRESVREARDFAWLGLIIGHIFVVAEAFVDRHLMKFDVTDDLSIHLKAFDNGQLLSLSIPLN